MSDKPQSPKNSADNKFTFHKKDTACTNDIKFKVDNTKLLLLLALSVLFYVTFILTSKIIHRIGISDLSDVGKWLLVCAQENDGIELYVMTFAMPLYLLLSYLIINYSKINFPYLSKKYISMVYIMLVIGLITINLVLKEPIVFRTLELLIIVLLISWFIIILSKLRFSKITKVLVYACLFVLFTFICLLACSKPSIYDYSYFIGPANKFLGGEKYGTYYIQYSTIGTLLFAVMQKYHLLIDQMQIVLSVLFAFWMLVYTKAASLLFKNRVIVGLFLLSILIVRCLSIWGGPVSLPQVSSIRMDLWVPLLLVVIYLGFQSVITAFVFSACYMLDDTFGFMYLSLYIVIIIYYFYIKWYSEKKLPLSFKNILFILLPVIAYSIHLYIFGSFGSLAGKIFSQYHFGFMPISDYSSFWIIAFILPVCLYFLCKNKENRILYLFIFGLACIQLTYFFGRSHEHNLRNISGIIIFILFLTADALYSLTSRKKVILWATVFFTGCMAANFNSTIWEKIDLAYSKIKNRSLIEPNQIEKQIEAQGKYLKTFDPKKIIVISDIDSYINYRLGYKQQGYFSPFYANFSTKKTIEFLKDRLNNGCRLIVFPQYYLDYSPLLLNNDQLLVSHKERFVLDPLKENLFEMKLVNY